MGNSPSTTSEEQNREAGADALAIFSLIGVDVNDGVTLLHWQQAFDALDADLDGNISRKQWYVKRGTTAVYDFINKKNPGNVRKFEWESTFVALDTNEDGKVYLSEWLARKKVLLGFVEIGLSMDHWGVGVGSDFYEAPSQTEMAIAGPKGITAYGSRLSEASAKERWQEAMKVEVMIGERDSRTWLEDKEEPRSRSKDLWSTLEHAGWSSKSTEEIEEWIQQWVGEHPKYAAMCDDQTFAMDFVSWLTHSTYRRQVYGGLSLLSSSGFAYQSRKSARKKAKGSDAGDSESTACPDSWW